MSGTRTKPRRSSKKERPSIRDVMLARRNHSSSLSYEGPTNTLICHGNLNFGIEGFKGNLVVENGQIEPDIDIEGDLTLLFTEAVSKGEVRGIEVAHGGRKREIKCHNFTINSKKAGDVQGSSSFPTVLSGNVRVQCEGDFKMVSQGVNTGESWIVNGATVAAKGRVYCGNIGGTVPTKLEDYRPEAYVVAGGVRGEGNFIRFSPVTFQPGSFVVVENLYSSINKYKNAMIVFSSNVCVDHSSSNRMSELINHSNHKVSIETRDLSCVLPNSPAIARMALDRIDPEHELQAFYPEAFKANLG